MALIQRILSVDATYVAHFFVFTEKCATGRSGGRRGRLRHKEISKKMNLLVSFKF